MSYETHKPLLRMVSKSNDFQTLVDKTWEKYKQHLNTNSRGDELSKGDFKAIMRTKIANLDGNKSLNQKFKEALKQYDTSTNYRSAGDRLRSITYSELFKGTSEYKGKRVANWWKVQHLSRNKGRFRAFEPEEFKYLTQGTRWEKNEDGEDIPRNYTVYKYFNAYIVTLNSPQQTLVFDSEEYNAWLQQ